MTQSNINLQALIDPDNPLDPTQWEILRRLCEAAENGEWVPRLALYAAVGLDDPDPDVNSYGLRRKLGSITQRLGTSAWYRADVAAAAVGGRRYRLPDDLCDAMCDLLDLVTV